MRLAPIRRKGYMVSAVLDTNRAHLSGLRGCRFRLSPWGSAFWGLLLATLGLLAELGCDQGGSGQLQPGSDSNPATLVPLSNMVPIRAGTFLRIKYPVTLTHN